MLFTYKFLFVAAIIANTIVTVLCQFKNRAPRGGRGGFFGYDQYGYPGDAGSGHIRPLQGVNNPYIPPPSNGPTVVDIAKSNDDFSILVTALERAGLIAILSGPGPFTVNAPTNDAFIALIQALGITADELLAIPSLGEILLYHVIGGDLKTDELKNENGNNLPTLNGQTVRIDANDYNSEDNTGIKYISKQSGTAEIIIANIEASNGIVHAINAVLLPLFPSVYDIAASFEDFSLLVTAVDTADLTHTLTRYGPFTVFAPTNDAFTALITALGITVDDLLNIPSLKEILLYHVIGGYVLKEDLLNQNGRWLQTLNGQTFKVSADNSGNIQLTDKQGGNANIGLSDVRAKNGVVHVIDAVLLPLFDNVLEIAKSFDSFSILVIAVETAGLTEVLSKYGPFTVFAPTNDAFTALLQELDITTEDLLKLPILKEVVLYHVIGDFLLTSDLLKISNNEKYIKTLIPDRQTIQITNDGSSEKLGIIDQQRRNTNIGLSNVQAKNGVVHVIDRVLLPLFQNVVQIATSFDKFSILVQAVNTAKLTDTLTGPGPFTVFAPTNDAFSILFDELRIDIKDLLNIPTETLQFILLYHVITDFLTTDTLKHLIEENYRNIQTANGQTVGINTCDECGDAGLALIDQQSDISVIGLSDVRAKNGIAHVIDRVLIPLFASVIQVAKSFDDYSILVKLVKTADLEDVLSDSEAGPFTVFAPNNKAFGKLLDELMVTLDDIVNLPILRDVLLYHVAGKYLLTKDLETGDQLMLNGQTTFINMDNYDGYQQGFSINGNIHLKDQQHRKMEMIIGNVETQNGVVHVIDRVMIPMFESVIQIATSFDDYTILVKLVETARLTEILSGDGPFTVFAPNNNAFNKLMKDLLITIEDLIKLPILRDVLFYHVIGEYLLSTDLPKKGNLETVNGQSVYINTEHYDGYRNGFDIKGIYLIDQQRDRADVIIGNVQSKNGVVHVIDDVLIPMFNSIMQIAMSFDDYSILVRLVKTAGLTDMLLRDGPFTVFAPNNHAFHKLITELKVTVDDIARMPNLRDVLFYHITNYYLLTKDLKSKKEGHLIMKNGQKLHVNTDGYKDDDGGFAVRGIHLIDQQSDVSNVIITNVEAKNGVVHVVDRVLILLFESIMQIARSFDDYSILVKAVHIAGLTEMLEKDGAFTVFAPNNYAFNQLSAVTHLSIDEILGLSTLRDVVLYHIHPKYLLTKDLKTGIMEGSNKEKVVLNTDKHKYQQGFHIPDIYVTDNHMRTGMGVLGNVESKNGVVHVIDRVLIPLLDTVVHIAFFYPPTTILEILLDASTTIPFLEQPGPFTCFAPSNAAFNILMDELHIDIEDLKAMPNLDDVIYYHCIHGHLWAKDFKTGSYETLHDGQMLQINADDYKDADDKFAVKGVYITDQQSDTATYFLPNVQSHNGVVHVIDRALILLFESIYQVASGFKDYSMCVQILHASGTADEMMNDGPFTTFAPHNSAIIKLMDELLIDMDDLINMPGLEDMVWYHVTDKYLTTMDFPTGPLDMLNGQTVDINMDGYVYNQGFGVKGITVMDQQHDASVQFIGNIETKNGVVHVMDRVLVLLFESVYTIATLFDDYTIVRQLIDEAGLKDTLEGPGPFTVFAPNNYAFDILMKELLIDIDDLINMPNLQDVLFYHIMGQYVLASDLTTGPWEMLNGQTVDIDLDGFDLDGYTAHDYGFAVRGIKVTDQQHDTAITLLGNVEAKNGVVHVVDRVLILLFESVYQVATLFDDYSILVDAVDAANLTDTLEGPGPFTVFAPNNAAFMKLLDELDITLEDLLDLPILGDVLLYHIIGDYLLANDLPSGSVEMLYEGHNMLINKDNYTPIDQGFAVTGIQLTDEQTRMSYTLLGNVEAKNGVVHVIDRVMVPLFDSVLQIAVIYPKTTILEQLVIAAGLAETLEGPGPFTVFAPNDYAFMNLMDELMIDMDDLLNLPILPEVILYHAIGEYLLSTDLMTDNVLTLNGQTMLIRVNDYDGMMLDGFVVKGIHIEDNQHDISNVLLGNVQAQNGVVYVVDRVLLPLFESVYEIAVIYPKTTILEQLVDAANLTDILKGPGPFTVFAPNDAAMLNLLDELEITLEDLLNLPTDVLQGILLYHVIGDFLLAQDLSTGSIETLQGGTIDVNTDNADYADNGFYTQGIFLIDQQNDISNMIIANVEAKNGVVHVIDRVLLPLLPSVYLVATLFDDYSILVALVDKAGLTDTLNQMMGPFTVFAPNNNAFYDLMDELQLTMDDLLNLPNLQNVLLYHVIPSYLLAADLSTQSYQTINGALLHINVDNYESRSGFDITGIYMTDNSGRKANAIIGNVETENGVVHVIDRVLIPSFETVVAIATVYPPTSILEQLLFASNTVPTLIGPGPFTVFAPNDDAFNVLMEELHIDIDDLLNLPNLDDVIFYHVVNDYLLSNDLTTGNLPTLHNGQTVTVNTDNYDGLDVKAIYLMDEQSDKSYINLGNVVATNGVVHVIDRVLIPLFESVYQVATLFDDYSILLQAVDTAGLDGALQGPGPFTVFAPNNDAFLKLLDELEITIEDLLNLPILEEVLLYHVVANYLLASQLPSGSIETLYSGHNMLINTDSYIANYDGFDVEGIQLTDEQTRMSYTILGNVETKNGVVHVIDRVMLPLFDTVLQIAVIYPVTTILEQLVIAAGLEDALQGPGPFTVFAPNDAAMLNLLDELQITIDDLLALPTLDEILLYHVIAGYLLSTDLYTGNKPTLNGQTISVNVDGYDGYTDGFDIEGIWIYDNQHDISNVLLGNVLSKNGVVYVIDRVLVPLFEYVYEIAAIYPKTTILKQLVDIAGLTDILQGPGPFTVFAPNDEAMLNLLDELQITIDDLLNLPTDTLKQILLYHVLNDFVLASDLSNGNLLTAQGQTISVNVDNYEGDKGFYVKGVYLIDHQTRKGTTSVGNVEAKNGVVHVIDRVLVPLFESVVQVATSFDNYSILVALLNKAGLTNTLSGSGPFTVFAPNDNAFDILMDELLIDMDDLLNLAILDQVLLYHVIGGYMLSTDLSTQRMITLQGQTILMNVDNYDGYTDGFDIRGIYLEDNQHDISNVIIGNVQTRNGVVYGIDRVLIPLFENVVQVATGFNDYSILVQLINAAGLTDILSGSGPFTVFAPNNAAFNKLMDELDIDLSDLLNLPTLADILKFHVINDYLLTSDLSTGPISSLQGQNILINADNYQYNQGFIVSGIELIDPQNRMSSVIIGNIETTNGVVHVIDRVMIPLFDTIVDIATSFDDFSVLAQAIIAANLTDALSGSGPLTVFAPNNAAFNELLVALSVSVDELLNLPILQNLLLYHVISDFLLTSDLANKNGEDIITLNGGETVTINVDHYIDVGTSFSVKGVQLIDKQPKISQIILSNVGAINGVVHAIDKVLLPQFDTVVDIATSFNDFSILAQIVDVTDLTSTLSGPGPYTIFAPTNEAFYKLLTELDTTLSDLLALPNLSEILSYHLCDRIETRTDLMSYNGKNMATLNGQTIEIIADESGISLHDQQSLGTATIGLSDIPATNGMFHIIDHVLLPLFDTVTDVIGGFGEFSIFNQALNTAQLTDRLSGYGPYTLFAPRDDAFNQLLLYLNININDFLDIKNLEDILLYHIIDDYLMYTDLLSNDGVDLITSISDGQTININVRDEIVTLFDGQGDISSIGINDIKTKNGVVHIIDNVLLPTFQTVVDIISSIDSFSILIELLNKAQLIDTLKGSGPYTIFAPNNDVFNALFFKLNININDLLNYSNLSDLLKYHVIFGNKLEINDLMEENGRNIITLNGETIEINVANQEEIGLFDQNGDESKIIIQNLNAQNGCVHVIDNVLFPNLQNALA